MNFVISVWTLADFGHNINDRGITKCVPYQRLLFLENL